ncbi:hypothetical protein RUND412_008161 [Rhizina undulata]
MHVSPRYESLFHHTRRIIDIEDPQSWAVTTVLSAFGRKLFKARPHLKSLQWLWLNCALPGLPDEGWRERVMIRDTWRAKILQEFTHPDDYVEEAVNSSGPSSLAKAAPNSNGGKRKRGRTAKVTEIQKPGSRRDSGSGRDGSQSLWKRPL